MDYGYSDDDLEALNREETQSGECWTCDRVFINGWHMIQHIREAHGREPMERQGPLGAVDQFVATYGDDLGPTDLNAPQSEDG